MGLEWIASIWDEEDDTPTRFESPDHFAGRGAIILYVFEDFVAEDQVKGPGRERKVFPSRINDMRRFQVRFSRALEIVFQPDDLAPEQAEMLHVHADPTPIFQDATFHALARAPGDHFQPAFLPSPPDIRWFSA